MEITDKGLLERLEGICDRLGEHTHFEYLIKDYLSKNTYKDRRFGEDLEDFTIRKIEEAFIAGYQTKENELNNK